MTLTMDMENFKKRKNGGALAIVVLKTSRHSQMPVLGRLRAIPASDPSMHLKTVGPAFCSELLFPLQAICLFNFPSKYIYRIVTNSKKLMFIAGVFSNSPEGEQRLELLQLVVGKAEIK